MTEQEALVSIIVPIYGTEKYLPACIDSICKQSYPNLQIILVDDQSPDKCPEICDAYAEKDNRIIVVHQKNKGVSGARNTGIKLATGDYIMFVDSDDLLYPEAVDVLMKDMIEYNAHIVSSLPKLVDVKGKFVKNSGNGDCEIVRGCDSILLSLKGEQSTDSVWAKLFKTDFIKDIYFEEGKNINEDGFFMFQCCIRKPVIVQRETSIYQYNIRPGSSSRQTFSDKYLAMLYFCNRKKEFILSHFPQYTEQLHNMEVRTNLQLLDLLCSTKEKEYAALQKQCIKTVRELYKYHEPINDHHKKLAWIVNHGMYPLYKVAVWIKYYR